MINIITYKEIKENLTNESLKILFKLNNVTKMSYSELKEAVGLNKNLLYREIARLEGACLIRKYKEKSNFKATYYSITDHGINLFKL